MVRSYRSNAERREKTIQAVVALSAEHDPATLTTTHIANFMELTQGALFRHFPSKHAIFESVVHWATGQIMHRVEHAAQNADSPLGALEAVFHAYVQFVVEHPGVPRILIGQLQARHRTPAGTLVRQFLDDYHDFIAGLMQEAMDDGLVRHDIPATELATEFMTLLQGLVFQSLILGHHNEVRREGEVAYQIFSRGLASLDGH